MHFSEGHLALLKSIQDEWNRAEEDIKTAEMVVHSIVIPSIKELRYGGRRVIDALMVIAGNPENPDHDRIKALLDDARFDCHRARHDAIDAATAKIAADLEIMVEKLGYESILPAFSAFPSLYQNLTIVRDQIRKSRGKRDDREAIYSVIEAADFSELVSAFNNMRTCEPIMVALAKKNRRNIFFGKWGFIVGVVGLIVGMIGIVFAVIALK